MDDIFCVELASTCHDSLPNFDWSLRNRFPFNFGSAGPLQRTCNARTHPEVVVRCIHHSLHIGMADIALLNFKGGLTDPQNHRLIIRSIKVC